MLALRCPQLLCGRIGDTLPPIVRLLLVSLRTHTWRNATAAAAAARRRAHRNLPRAAWSRTTTSTQCRSRSLNPHSVGGRSKCRSAAAARPGPPAGATCSSAGEESGIIALLLGFFPGDTRLLTGTGSQSVGHNGSLIGIKEGSLESVPPLDETTVLYRCWSAEACASPGGNQALAVRTATAVRCAVCATLASITWARARCARSAGRTG